MNISRIVALGIEPGVLASLRPLLEAAAVGARVEVVERLEDLDEPSLSRAGTLLLVDRVVPGGEEAGAFVARLRGRGIIVAALRLAPAGEATGTLDGVADLPPEPAEEEVRRALAHARDLASLGVRIGELETRLRDSEEVQRGLQRRVEQLSHQLALQEIDDELTGLRNERYMTRRLEEAIALARRYGAQITCLLIGIDGLDPGRTGTADSAFVLVQVAHRLKRSIRTTDQLSRHGDDGFLLLCPFTSEGGALIVARRLQKVVGRPPIDDRGAGAQVTISVGIATLRPEMSAPEEWLRAAAGALARAREQGNGGIEAA